MLGFSNRLAELGQGDFEVVSARDDYFGGLVGLFGEGLGFGAGRCGCGGLPLVLDLFGCCRDQSCGLF